MKEIITDRLILRPLESTDDERLFLLYSDKNVMKFIREPDSDIFQTKKRIKAILDYSQSNSELGLWCAYLKDTDAFIGWGILVHIEHKSDNPIEIGYRLHQEFWKKGLATEMSLALIKHAKEEGISYLSAITIDDNIISKKIIEKIGLSYIEDRLYYEMQVKYYEINLKE